MKSHWVEHKGKRVFIADYSNFGINAIALQKEADGVIPIYLGEPANSVLAISNVEGTKATTAIVKVLTDILSHSNKVVKKRCVVGVSGIRWTFLEAFNQLAGKTPFISFDTVEEALDWIVQD